MKKTPFGFEKITEVIYLKYINFRLMEDQLKFSCVVWQKKQDMLKVLDGLELSLNEFYIIDRKIKT